MAARKSAVYSRTKEKDAQGNTVIEKSLLKELRGLRKDGEDINKERKKESKNTELDRQLEDHQRKQQNKDNSSSVRLLNLILNDKKNLSKLDHLAANGDTMAQDFKNMLHYNKDMINQLADNAAQGKDMTAYEGMLYEKYFGKLQKQLEAFGGELRVSMKDLAGSMAEQGQQTPEAIKKNIGMLSEILKTNADKLAVSMNPKALAQIQLDMANLAELASKDITLTKSEQTRYNEMLKQLGAVDHNLKLSKDQAKSMGATGLKSNKSISDVLEQLLALAGELWGLTQKGYFDIIAPGLGRLATNLTMIYRDLKGAFGALKKLLGPFVEKFWNNFTRIFPGLTSAFEGMMKGVWAFLSTIASIIFEVMFFVLQAALLAGIGAIFYKMGSYLVENFWEIIEFLQDSIITYLKLVANTLINIPAALWDMGAFLIENFWDVIEWLGEYLEAELATLGELFRDILDAIPGMGRSDEEEAADEAKAQEKRDKVLTHGAKLIKGSKVVDNLSNDRFGAAESLAQTGKSWDAIGTGKSALRTSQENKDAAAASIVPDVAPVMGQKQKRALGPAPLKEVSPLAPAQESKPPPVVKSIQSNTGKGSTSPSSQQPGRKMALNDNNMHLLNLGAIT